MRRVYEIRYYSEYVHYPWFTKVQCAYSSIGHHVRLAIMDWGLDHLTIRKMSRKLIWRERIHGNWSMTHTFEVREIKP